MATAERVEPAEQAVGGRPASRVAVAPWSEGENAPGWAMVAADPQGGDEADPVGVVAGVAGGSVIRERIA